MAKNEMTEKKENTNFLKKTGLFFKNLGMRIVRSFKDMFAEMKKVTWPDRKMLTNYTVVVLVFMAVMAVIIGLIDSGAAALVQLITQ